MSFLKLKPFDKEQTDQMEQFRLNKVDFVVMLKTDDGKISFEDVQLAKTTDGGMDQASLKGQHQEMVDLVTNKYKDEPCYILYNAHTVYNSMLVKKACIILWNPESGPMKAKMTYASSFEDVKSLVKAYGSPKAFQADQLNELSYDDIIGSMSKKV